MRVLKKRNGKTRGLPARPVRILHLVHSLEVGGLERVSVDLSRGLMERGHHVQLCTLSTKGPLGLEAERDGFDVFCMHKKPGVDFRLPFRISKIISDNEIDLIHTHNAAGLLYGVSGAFLSGLRSIVHTEHGKDLDYSEKGILQACKKFLLRRLISVVAVSPELRRELLMEHALRSDRVTVITNGIDTEHFYQPGQRAEKRRELGLKSKDFVIGSIGRLVAIKNHKFLILVFRKVIEKFSEAKLLIVGDGPLKEKLVNDTRSIGLESSVMFLGQRRDIAELLSTFDLFVLPSLTEGISITLLEAMAGAIPAIASTVGGNGEIIEDGRSGILLGLRDPLLWAETIKALKQDTEKRLVLGEAGRRRAIEKFSLSHVVRNYEKLYENVLKQTRTRKGFRFRYLAGLF